MFIFSRLKMYLLSATAAVAALIGIYLKGKHAGKKQVENEHNRRRIDAMKTAKDVRDEVESDPDLVRRASEWVHTNDKR